LAGLKLLVGAVSASGFISARKSAELIKKLTAFAGGHQTAEGKPGIVANISNHNSR